MIHPLAARLLLGSALALAALGAGAFCIICPQTSYLIEYENSIVNRHVWISDADEMRAIDTGAAGPGWRKNGHTIATIDATNPALVDVCRFYAPSVNSHFVTADAAECAALKASNGPWIFDKVAFKAYPASHASCPWPIYRLRNDNHVARNTSVHRFTWDPYLRARLVEDGWVEEGVAFCGTQGFRTFELSEIVRSDQYSALQPSAECDNRVGSCVMARNLPSLSNSVAQYDAQGRRNPAFDSAYDEIMGTNARATSLHTAEPIADPAAVARHSFILTGSWNAAEQFGFRLDGRDRLSGDYATMAAVYRFPPADARFAPWAGGLDRDLTLRFTATIRAVRPFDANSHAYGLGLLQFRDQGSGRVFNVTLGTFGTLAAGGFAARDVISGQVLVSVPFAAGLDLGFARAGRYLACLGAAQPNCAPGTHQSFEYAISRADFAKAIARARDIDPALSPDPRDYAVASFQVRAETYRDAEVAVWFGDVVLSVSQ